MNRTSLSSSLKSKAKTAVPRGSVVGVIATTAILTSFSLAMGGCDDSECGYYNNCPSGSYCTLEGVCIDRDSDGGTRGILPTPRADGGMTGVGDGGTPIGNTAPHNIQTPAAVSWIENDPTDSDSILVGYYTAAGFDQIRRISMSSPPTVLPTANADFDLFNMVNGNGGPNNGCNPDNIFFDPDLTTGETWIACRIAPVLRVVYNEDTANNYLPLQGGGFVLGARVTPLNPNPSDGTNTERRVTFHRGGSGIASYRLNNFDTPLVARMVDDMSALSFVSITQMWTLESTVLGETVLVFDRGDAMTPPRLVPIFRQFGTNTWVVSGGQQQLSPIELPEETFAVVPFGEIPVNAGGAPGYGNIMTLEPTTGIQRFWRYDGTTQQNPVQVSQFLYEPDASQRPTMLPSAEDRLMLSPTPSGDYVFLALQNARRVWRIEANFSMTNPIPDSIPLRRTFADDTLIPTGLASSSDETSFWAVQPDRQLIVRDVVGMTM